MNPLSEILMGYLFSLLQPFAALEFSFERGEKTDMALPFLGGSRIGPSDIKFIITIAILTIVFLVFILIYRWYMNRQIQTAQEEYQKKKKETILERLDVSQNALKTIQTLAAQTNKSWEDLLSSNHYFESAVTLLQTNSPEDPLLARIPNLRDELGYVFFNRRVPFITSKMLQVGHKVRAGVSFKGKSHSYVTTILNTTENELWIKPPTVKSKTVDLSNFETLDFNVFRKNDGEYRFSCMIKTQITTPVHAVVTSHSSAIKKLQTREYDRYALQFKTNFFFIVSKAKNDVTKSQYSGISVHGQVADISLGGMKFYVKDVPPKTKVGTVIFFFMKEAKIEKEIHGKIVRIGDDEKKTSVHLQFQGLSELSRLRLQKYIAARQAEKLTPF